MPGFPGFFVVSGPYSKSATPPQPPKDTSADNKINIPDSKVEKTPGQGDFEKSRDLKKTEDSGSNVNREVLNADLEGTADLKKADLKADLTKAKNQVEDLLKKQLVQDAADNKGNDSKAEKTPKQDNLEKDSSPEKTKYYAFEVGREVLNADLEGNASTNKVDLIDEKNQAEDLLKKQPVQEDSSKKDAVAPEVNKNQATANPTDKQDATINPPGATKTPPRLLQQETDPKVAEKFIKYCLLSSGKLVQPQGYTLADKITLTVKNKGDFSFAGICKELPEDKMPTSILSRANEGNPLWNTLKDEIIAAWHPKAEELKKTLEDYTVRSKYYNLDFVQRNGIPEFKEKVIVPAKKGGAELGKISDVCTPITKVADSLGADFTAITVDFADNLADTWSLHKLDAPALELFCPHQYLSQLFAGGDL